MFGKKKQKHKTKEEIIQEKENKVVEEKRKKFIEETFMPEMNKLTKNLEESQALTDVIKQSINQWAQAKAMSMLVKDLGLYEALNKMNKPELVWKHKKIIEILQEQPVGDALRICDGLYDEVNRVLSASIKEKKLSDFQNNEPIKKETV